MLISYYIMKKKLTEQGILFASIIKWVTRSTVIGLVVGISTTFYLKILEFSERSSSYSYYFLLLPVAMFLSVLIVKYLAPNAEGHGTEKVIEAVHIKIQERLNQLSYLLN